MEDIKKFLVNVKKRIQQEAATKMQQKMDRAAAKVIAKANSEREFSHVTGNLWKSIAVGTFYQGELVSIHHTPGPDPTRPTLAKGESYNLPYYYGSSVPLDMMTSGKKRRKPFRGEYGEGGQDGERAAEDALFSMELDGMGMFTWRLAIVAGVDYANYVEKHRGHNVISSLGQYMSRYYRSM